MTSFPTPAFDVWMDANPIARNVFRGFIALVSLTPAIEGVATGDVLLAAGGLLFAAAIFLLWWNRLPRLIAPFMLIGWGTGNILRGSSNRSINLTPTAQIWVVSLGVALLIWAIYRMVRDKRKREKNKGNS